ncbi:jg18007 [Pararge aegeria aegeria]|uniref:Jg18007 protein n=1 Tax=Pararge aegeria aegeria TaxID=348720 RepID=A0A8S4RNN9_9NEOP|nr:jg18007 [Pararge aegeria aegeria]
MLWSGLVGGFGRSLWPPYRQRRTAKRFSVPGRCHFISFFGRTLADNHLRGCYGVTGGVGRARKLAKRRAPGLDDIGGEVGNVDPRVPPARTRTSARFEVNLTVGGLLD